MTDQFHLDDGSKKRYKLIRTVDNPPFKFQIHTNTLPTCFARRHCTCGVLRAPLHAKHGCCHLSEMELCNASIIHQSLFRSLRPQLLAQPLHRPTHRAAFAATHAHTCTPRSQRPADSAAIVSEHLVSCSLNRVNAELTALCSQKKRIRHSVRTKLNERRKLQSYRERKKNVLSCGLGKPGVAQAGHKKNKQNKPSPSSL